MRARSFIDPRWWGLVLATGLSASGSAVAAAASQAKAGTGAKTEEADTLPSKTVRRDVTKTRPGSLLRKEESPTVEPDLRGDAERRRDLELVRHFARVAELDVIEQIAARQDDGALLERVEAVRRKELRRHWAALQQLRAWALLKNWQGNP